MPLEDAQVTYAHVHKAHSLPWVGSIGVVNTKPIFVAILARVVDLKQSQAFFFFFFKGRNRHTKQKKKPTVCGY